MQRWKLSETHSIQYKRCSCFISKVIQLKSTKFRRNFFMQTNICRVLIYLFVWMPNRIWLQFNRKSNDANIFNKISHLIAQHNFTSILEIVSKQSNKCVYGIRNWKSISNSWEQTRLQIFGISIQIVCLCGCVDFLFIWNAIRWKTFSFKNSFLSQKSSFQ